MPINRARLEASALTLLRNAAAQGLDDDACIAFAVAAMGREHEPLIGRVWARGFKIYGGAG